MLKIEIKFYLYSDTIKLVIKILRNGEIINLTANITQIIPSFLILHSILFVFMILNEHELIYKVL